MFDQFLRWQVQGLLTRPGFLSVVRAYAEDGVEMIKRLSTVNHVCADYRVVQIGVMHGERRALDVEAL
ncbi:hypothetical protein D3C81_2147770 [compost metagenome]